ncbi:hypothetical protein [Escherichia coli]|uniref:hypothetical protein n=1 Tax=Escherichia coli TaxID=562 RepID=UPI0039A51DB0
MSRYIFLILILGFVGGGHSKSQANSDVNILQSHVSVNTHGSTERGYLVVNGDYQSGYKILIKGGGVGIFQVMDGVSINGSIYLKERFFVMIITVTHIT